MKIYFFNYFLIFRLKRLHSSWEELKTMAVISKLSTFFLAIKDFQTRKFRLHLNLLDFTLMYVTWYCNFIIICFSLIIIILKSFTGRCRVYYVMSNVWYCFPPERHQHSLKCWGTWIAWISGSHSCHTWLWSAVLPAHGALQPVAYSQGCMQLSILCVRCCVWSSVHIQSQ